MTLIRSTSLEASSFRAARPSSHLAARPAGRACGSDSADDSDRPTVSATTGILADITEQVAGDDATVEQVIPDGASPHDFQLSAEDRAEDRGLDSARQQRGRPRGGDPGRRDRRDQVRAHRERRGAAGHLGSRTSGWTRPGSLPRCRPSPTRWRGRPRSRRRLPPRAPSEYAAELQRLDAELEADAGRDARRQPRARHLPRRARLLRRPLRVRGRRDTVPGIGRRGRGERGRHQGGRGRDPPDRRPDRVRRGGTTTPRCWS